MQQAEAAAAEKTCGESVSTPASQESKEIAHRFRSRESRERCRRFKDAYFKSCPGLALSSTFKEDKKFQIQIHNLKVLSEHKYGYIPPEIEAVLKDPSFYEPTSAEELEKCGKMKLEFEKLCPESWRYHYRKLEVKKKFEMLASQLSAVQR